MKPTWDDGSEPQKLKERMERPLREHCILATVILGTRPTILYKQRISTLPLSNINGDGNDDDDGNTDDDVHGVHKVCPRARETRGRPWGAQSN